MDIGLCIFATDYAIRIDDLAREMAGQATICKVNVEAEPAIAERFGVRVEPETDVRAMSARATGSAVAATTLAAVSFKIARV